MTTTTGLDVFAYLDKELFLPIMDGMQAPGDHIVVPYSLLKGFVSTGVWTRIDDVPLSGIELLRSAAGGNPTAW